MMDMFADSLIRKGIRDFSSLIGDRNSLFRLLGNFAKTPSEWKAFKVILIRRTLG
jgi:hypothetical protein